MKVLAVRLARSIWLMPSYFLNPKGVYLRPANDAVKARYDFLKTPFDGPMPPPNNEGVKFENGAFKGKNGVVEITSLTMHNDGIVIDTRSSTDDADLFMEDLINWTHKEFGLPALSELPAKRIYASELNVVFKRAPEIINPKLAPFLENLDAEIGDGHKGKLSVLSLQFSTDQTLSKSPGIFRLDREINVPFDENRFYSFSPTKTDFHIKLLEKLEKLAS